MSWRVDIDKRAQRNLKRIPEPHRGRLYKGIYALADNPKPRSAGKLGKEDPVWRVRVGDYRFLYTLDRKEKVVRIVDAGHRKDIYRRNPPWVPNPAARAGRVPVEYLTDRAKRYRAQRLIPNTERRCIYCGAPPAPGRRLEVEHIDGRESNLNPENLAWTCRSCNTRKGAYFARRRAGQRTRQFNPARKKKPITGARTLAEYMETLNALHGYASRFTLQEAIEKMHNTPPEDRSAFAHEIWDRRRARGTDTWAVPF